MDTTEDLIKKTKQITGGHLHVGRHGYTLHIDDGHRLSGYDINKVKQLCIEAGGPTTGPASRRSIPIS
jgi:hypothetical protein